MVVDPRRDHSLRIPRPDLSAALGTPNACNRLSSRSPAPVGRRARSRLGRTAAAPVQATSPGARRRAARASGRGAGAGRARERPEPAGHRARDGALPLAGVSRRGRDARGGARLRDGDALVRAAALPRPTAARRASGALAAPLLRDPVKAVRLAAAQALADLPAARSTAEQRADFDRASGSLASELVNADRPEAHLNLANLYGRLGRPARPSPSSGPRSGWTRVRSGPGEPRRSLARRGAGRGRERFLEQALDARPSTRRRCTRSPSCACARGGSPRRSTCSAARAARRPERSRASPTCTRWRSTIPASGRGRPRCSRGPTAGARQPRGPGRAGDVLARDGKRAGRAPLRHRAC